MSIQITTSPASTAPYDDLRTLAIKLDGAELSVMVSERADGTYLSSLYSYEVAAIVQSSEVTAPSFVAAIGLSMFWASHLIGSPELDAAIRDRAELNARHADTSVGEMLGDLMGRHREEPGDPLTQEDG